MQQYHTPRVCKTKKIQEESLNEKEIEREKKVRMLCARGLKDTEERTEETEETEETEVKKRDRREMQRRKRIKDKRKSLLRKNSYAFSSILASPSPFLGKLLGTDF